MRGRETSSPFISLDLLSEEKRSVGDKCVDEKIIYNWILKTKI
jgi:hypothetical protein